MPQRRCTGGEYRRELTAVRVGGVLKEGLHCQQVPAGNRHVERGLACTVLVLHIASQLQQLRRGNKSTLRCCAVDVLPYSHPAANARCSIIEGSSLTQRTVGTRSSM